jgi:hypothetical protein
MRQCVREDPIRKPQYLAIESQTSPGFCHDLSKIKTVIHPVRRV